MPDDENPNLENRVWVGSGEDYEARHWPAKLDCPPQQSKDVDKAAEPTAQLVEDPIKSTD